MLSARERVIAIGNPSGTAITIRVTAIMKYFSTISAILYLIQCSKNGSQTIHRKSFHLNRYKQMTGNKTLEWMWEISC